MINNFHNIKKILVIKLRHLGDVLLTVPVFRALRENFHDAQISALVNSGTEDVLTGNALINEIIVRNIRKTNRLKRLFKDIYFLREIRAKGFDMSVDLTSGDSAAIISFVSGARYRLAYDPGNRGFFGKRYLYTHLAKLGSNLHTVHRNLNLVKQFGIDTTDHNVDFYIPEDAKMFVKKVFRENNIRENDTVIHVHPTAKWLFKCWKDEYMAEIIRWLVDEGFKVVVTSSPNHEEMDKVNRILSLYSLNNRVLNLSGTTSIKQLGAISAASALFLGIDTAPMHIAAAVGTPVIALFGAGEKQWRPWGEGHVAISKEEGKRDGMRREKYVTENLARITPDNVKKEVRRFLFDKE